MSYTIGAPSFTTFARPRKTAQQTLVESRPGTDGHSLWLLGNRGQPVEIETTVDVASATAAATTFDAYLAMVGTNVAVVWAGASVGNFDVLDVQPVKVGATVLGVGGVSGASGGIVIARWTLIPTV